VLPSQVTLPSHFLLPLLQYTCRGLRGRAACVQGASLVGCPCFPAALCYGVLRAYRYRYATHTTADLIAHVSSGTVFAWLHSSVPAPRPPYIAVGTCRGLSHRMAPSEYNKRVMAAFRTSSTRRRQQNPVNQRAGRLNQHAISQRLCRPVWGAQPAASVAGMLLAMHGVMDGGGRAVRPPFAHILAVCPSRASACRPDLAPITPVIRGTFLVGPIAPRCCASPCRCGVPGAAKLAFEWAGTSVCGQADSRLRGVGVDQTVRMVGVS
jgi:hypothetical protein